MFKNIIFDVGKVLISWDPTETMRDQLGFSKEAIDAITSALFVPGVWEEEDKAVMSKEELLSLFVSQAPEYENEIRLFYDHATDSVKPKEYSRSWISSLKAAGYNVYVLSNFGEGAFQNAVRLGGINFLDLLDGYIFSYSVKMIKPYPEIYNCLLERYKLNAEECIFIDDTAVNIAGGEAVGIKGIVFTSYEQACKDLAALDVHFKA